MDLIVNIMKNPFEEADKLSISELEKVIEYASDKFFNDESVISDAIYDMLVDFLTLKNPKSKVLKKIGANVKSKDKVKLDYYLGSMDKIKPPSNKLEKWLSQYSNPYVLSEKLDGVSALIIYKNDGSIKLYTRGTATHGLDISPLLKYINMIPHFESMKEFVTKNKIKASKKENMIAFRGELIISKEEFDKNWSSTKSNARNTVSGLVNSKKIDPMLAKSTSLVIYELVDPNIELLEQLKLSKKAGFKTVHHKEVDKLDFEYLSKYLKNRKDKSKYIIDGIIVSNNSVHDKNKDGNPDYSFAFKDILEDQKAITNVMDVEWSISKDGYINPVVVIDPVEVGGVTINRVTAYNAKFIVDKKIGKGAKIEIIRSGDVIPKIINILKEASKVELPKTSWKWNETKVDIITCDMNCKEIEVRNIHYFFSSLDTKGMGQKVVEKIYESGLKNIPDILKASKDNFLSVEGFKDKSAENLVLAIKKAVTNNSQGLNLYQIMSASNKLGHGMGEERCKLILDELPNLMKDYKKWSKKEFIEKLKNIPGFEEKTSQQFVDNFPKFITFYNKIEKYILIKKKAESKKNTKITGKVIVISGFRDKEVEEKLVEYGAKVGSTVSKNTNILIVKDDNTIKEKTGKVQKALDLGVKIITKDDFKKLFST